MQIKSYIVNPGDSLSKIAAANETTVDALVSANSSIKDPNLIMVGQQIIIPETFDVSAVSNEALQAQALAEQQAVAAQAAAAQQAAQLQAQMDAQAAVEQAQAAAQAALQAQQAQAAQAQAAALKAQQEAELAATQAAQAAAAQQASISGVGAGDSASVAAALGITPAQLDVVKATIRHEAGNNPEAMYNVASVMRNRMNEGRWGGTDAYSVATAKGQFESYLKGYYKQYTGGNYYQGDPATAAQVDQVLNGILLGTVPVTNPHNSFYGDGKQNHFYTA